MRSSIRHQLAALDRAILALLDERALLLRDLPAGDPEGRAAVDDLLGRHRGPFDPALIPELMALVDRGCRRRQGGGEQT